MNVTVSPRMMMAQAEESAGVLLADAGDPAHFASICRGDQVIVQLIDATTRGMPQFHCSRFDKFIIPFSILQIDYSHRGFMIRQNIIPGEHLFIAAGTAELVIEDIECDDAIIIEACPKLRQSIRSHIADSGQSASEGVGVINHAPNLMTSAHVVRRLLSTPIKNDQRAVEAAGVLIVSEFLISQRRPATRGPLGISKEMLEKIDRFITCNIAENLTLAALADLCRMPTHRFSKIFKQTTGLSPYQYLLKRRVAFARQRITQTDQTLADIAYEAGFSSQSHMTEMFRRSFGVTPGKFRTGFGPEPGAQILPRPAAMPLEAAA